MKRKNSTTAPRKKKELSCLNALILYWLYSPIELCQLTMSFIGFQQIKKARLKYDFNGRNAPITTAWKNLFALSHFNTCNIDIYNTKTSKMITRIKTDASTLALEYLPNGLLVYCNSYHMIHLYTHESEIIVYAGIDDPRPLICTSIAAINSRTFIVGTKRFVAVFELNPKDYEFCYCLQMVTLMTACDYAKYCHAGLVIASQKGVNIWNCNTWHCIRKFEIPKPWPYYTMDISGLEIVHSKIVAVSCYYGITFWDLSNGKSTFSLRHVGIRVIKSCKNGLAVANDNDVSIYDIDGQITQKLPDCKYWENRFIVEMENKQLIVGSGDSYKVFES
jgi:WD40 repeat protein